MNIMEEIVGD